MSPQKASGEKGGDFCASLAPKPGWKKDWEGSLFVVHEHHASRLHWDFRLELDGALKSWAVPKEPSSDPAVKRLAVETEDHPLAYARFEGSIPEGNYGAGQVKVWDTGSFDVLERSDQKIGVSLHGKKLNGKFFLVKFEKAGPKHWLFFKGKEEAKEKEGKK